MQTSNRALVLDLYARLSGPDWPKLNSILDQTFDSIDLPTNIKNECADFLQKIKQDSRLSNKYVEDIDTHPSPMQHLAWVQNFLPEYDISQDTINWIKDIDQCLLNQKLYLFLPNHPFRF